MILIEIEKHKLIKNLMRLIFRIIYKFACQNTVCGLLASILLRISVNLQCTVHSVQRICICTEEISLAKYRQQNIASQ